MAERTRVISIDPESGCRAVTLLFGDACSYTYLIVPRAWLVARAKEYRKFGAAIVPGYRNYYPGYPGGYFCSGTLLYRRTRRFYVFSCREGTDI